MSFFYKKHYIYLLIFLFSAISCSDTDNGPVSSPEVAEQALPHRSLQEIKESGKLRALIAYSGTSYFLYRGQPMGFEYEILQRFADELGVELELVVSDNIDSLLPDLRAGKADLVAHGLTVTSDRKEQVQFTDYLYLTQQVLVQKKPEGWRKMRWSKLQTYLIKDAIELIDDTVSVRQASAYIERLDNLSDEIGGKIHIDTIQGSMSTDKIIKKVVDGEIEYTVADKNIASINASYYPSLNIKVPVSFSQRIAWATRKEDTTLTHEINKWVKGMKKEVDYYVIYNKYFKNKRRFRKQVKSEFYSLNKEKISPYDDSIRKNAEKIGWDWRLLASLVYQESRFKPAAQSWAGAKGLMQVMPATARELGIKNRADPKGSLRGGSKYLDQLFKEFTQVEDTIQRIKFAMASYNCGLGHVLDAQRLAEKRNLDPHRWDDNVEKMILALSYSKNYSQEGIRHGYVRGIEPYTYIRQIFKRHKHYVAFIPENPDGKRSPEEKAMGDPVSKAD